MTDWYRTIFPCTRCHNGPTIPSLKDCKKGRRNTHIEGCKYCGKLVNYDWYYNDIKCPDFDSKYDVDPSGS